MLPVLYCVANDHQSVLGESLSYYSGDGDEKESFHRSYVSPNCFFLGIGSWC